MTSIKEMNALQLSTFLFEESFANKDQAESFSQQDVDGVVLLSMSAEQLISHLSYTFGKAMRLLNWLRANLDLTQDVPAFKLCEDTKPTKSAKITAEKALMIKPLVVTNLASSNSSQRGMGNLPDSDLPPDPVTNVSDLRTRVYSKKPPDVYTNMWGRGYLESYHPRAHAIHNKNVEKMRGFFLDLYNPVVVRAWTSNFKIDKQDYKNTLEFIEKFCVPQLEDLIATIGGGSMHISWPATEIMRGWFLEHKKHNSSKRLEKISVLETENQEFLGTLPSTSCLENIISSNLLEDPISHTQEKGISNPLEDLDSHRAGNFSTDQNKDEGCLNMNLDSPEVSRTEIVGDSPSSSASRGSILGGNSPGYNTSEVSKKMVLANGAESDNEEPQLKRHRKTPLVVGNEELFGIDLQSMPGLTRRTKEPSVSTSSTDAHSPNLSLNSTETTNSTKLKQPKKAVLEFYPSNGAPFVARTRLPKLNSNHGKPLSTKLLPMRPGGPLTAKKLSDLNANPISKNSSRKENNFSSGIPSSPPRPLGIRDLDEHSKLTIAFKAMKLSNKKEVMPQLKSFIATQNRRAQLRNEQPSIISKTSLPFSGHQNMDMPALLDLLVTWALEYKVKIVKAPTPINGKVRLFSQHIEDK